MITLSRGATPGKISGLQERHADRPAGTGRIRRMTMSFPQQSARTRRFSLGVPRGFQIAPDGSYVSFLRTQGGTDPVTCLWTIDTASGEGRLVAGPGRPAP